jgi:nucleotide-binding universal stress UspA family protein
MGTIVVGVDGSAQSKGALEWAADEAQRRRASLTVVMVWENPNRDMWIPRIQRGEDRPLLLTERALDRVVEAVLGPRPRVPVEKVAVEGPAAKVLVERAKDAEMLVVGSRGRGGFGGVVLGSVSLHCASHARCPVVVVRGTGAARATATAPTRAPAKVPPRQRRNRTG